MGKKSKKGAGRAKAKAGGSSEASASSVASADSSLAQPAATATLKRQSSRNGSENITAVLAIGGNTSSAGSKKLRCISCLALLKDLAKAHQCPGCDQVYCWRCEQKRFRACLNGRNCLNPRLRRCTDCTEGKTMAKLCGVPVSEREASDFTLSLADYQEFVGLISNDERLSDAALPFRDCFTSQCRWDEPVADEQGLLWCRPSECNACASITDGSRPSYFRKCSQCILVTCTVCHQLENERVLAFARDLRDRHRTDDLYAELRSQFFGALVRCNVCEKDICISCNTTDLKREGRMIFDFENSCFHTTCPPCTEKKYWSAKPCTNPACPNEVGVPTKRCGGCHIARYCSVECQGMAHPAHKARCRGISAKRAAAAAAAAPAGK